jgi:hypothetical protein
MHCLRHTFTGLTALCVATAAAAGPLADPTRPPAALTAPGGLAAATLPHRANLDTARAIAAAARAADAPPPAPPAPPPMLQAVQVPTKGQATALVDGRPVTLGDLVDGRAVLAIDGQGLLLKGLHGPERLWLLAGTPKQAAGSIVHSQTARYQPAPLPGTPAPAANASNADPQQRGQSAASPSTTSAAPGSLSLAGRTAP